MHAQKSYFRPALRQRLGEQARVMKCCVFVPLVRLRDTMSRFFPLAPWADGAPDNPAGPF
eukprot:258050-Pyramimonas_sp.AAC.1